jgi:hypothetical protein
MRYGLAMLAVIAWGLWFGGMVALFLFVSYLFVTDRKIAMIAAPRMFAVFETYQLFVAAIALIAAAIWRLMSPGRAAITFIFMMLALSAIGTVALALAIRGPMEKLRLRGESSGPEFQRLHKLSERVYVAQAVALLAAGVIIPIAIAPPRPRSRPRTPETEPEAAEPTTPPGEPADRVASP